MSEAQNTINEAKQFFDDLGIVQDMRFALGIINSYFLSKAYQDLRFETNVLETLKNQFIRRAQLSTITRFLLRNREKWEKAGLDYQEFQNGIASHRGITKEEIDKMEEKTVSRHDLIEILIREHGCTKEDAQTQVGLAGPNGLIINGVRYIVGKEDKN